ncbi:MAG: hypothetical protein K2M12_02620, partial [Muribaculaceae bacterium]|nr:hypothetical protein [Muribaculaceae bacterium]
LWYTFNLRRITLPEAVDAMAAAAQSAIIAFFMLIGFDDFSWCKITARPAAMRKINLTQTLWNYY